MPAIDFRRRSPCRFRAPATHVAGVEIPDGLLALWVPSSSGGTDYARVIFDVVVGEPTSVKWHLELLDEAGGVLGSGGGQQAWAPRKAWQPTKLQVALPSLGVDVAGVRLTLTAAA